MVSVEQLKVIMPYAGPRAAVFSVPLNDAMDEFGIDSPLRQAAFIAQVAHESGSLRYVRELANGAVYEGRVDLGNRERGDGQRYKGRGLIQITGRNNYRDCSVALFGDAQILLDHPERLESTDDACRSAAWFWQSRRLNEFADQERFERITRIINGGVNGLAERQAFYDRAKAVLDV